MTRGQQRRLAEWERWIDDSAIVGGIALAIFAVEVVIVCWLWSGS